MAYPRAATVRVPLTHRPSVPPSDKYPPEVLRPLACQARRSRGDALCTRVRGRGILRSSAMLAIFTTIGPTAPMGSERKGGRRYAPVLGPSHPRRGTNRTSHSRRPHEGPRSPTKARGKLHKVLVQRG